MPDIYTKFSNYNEINLENRKESLIKELDKWGNDRDKFEKYRLEWKKASEEDYTPLNPLHVDIELSDACNLKCKMCVHGIETKYKSGIMAENTAKKLIKECSEIGVYSIKFNWRGEPVLNKNLPDLVLYAKQNNILEVQINTNGNVLDNNKDILIKCAENGIDRIIFSIDGFSKETYEAIRFGADYEKVMQTIHNLINFKKERKLEKPLIRVQMVRTKINSFEVDNFINYWQKLVDDVRISDVMDRGQGNSLSVGDQITIGRRRCPQPYQRMVVARDGRVSPCCADWDQQYVIGDINNDKLTDIWKNEKMYYMRNIQKNILHEKINICSNCCVKESYVWSKIK